MRWICLHIPLVLFELKNMADEARLNRKMASTNSFYHGKAVLITGASSGIGEELALQLAQSGAKLTLAARRKEQLELLAQKIAAQGQAAPLVIPCDVAHDGAL